MTAMTGTGATTGTSRRCSAACGCLRKQRAPLHRLVSGGDRLRLCRAAPRTPTATPTEGRAEVGVAHCSNSGRRRMHSKGVTDVAGMIAHIAQEDARNRDPTAHCTDHGQEYGTECGK